MRIKTIKNLDAGRLTRDFKVSASAATHCSYFCCGLRQSVQFQGRNGVKSIFDFWQA